MGLRDGHDAAALSGVPMSAPTTYDDTRGALVAAGRRVVSTAVLRDVDTVADARRRRTAAPDGQFAAAWRADGTPRSRRVRGRRYQSGWRSSTE